MNFITQVADLQKGMSELENDRITVGVGTCGLSAGGGKTLKKLQDANLGMLVEPVGCVGMCYAEPVVMVRQKGILSLYTHIDRIYNNIIVNIIRIYQ